MDGGCLWVAWLALAWAAVLSQLSREAVLMTLVNLWTRASCSPTGALKARREETEPRRNKGCSSRAEPYVVRLQVIFGCFNIRSMGSH